METTNDWLFLITVAFLLNHELDAIRKHEWRFFFALVPINDNRAYQLFTVIHVPLFVLILWNLSSTGFQAGFDVFMIVHALVHWLLRNHPKINFNDLFSRFWVFGGALLGAIHLLLLQL